MLLQRGDRHRQGGSGLKGNVFCPPIRLSLTGLQMDRNRTPPTTRRPGRDEQALLSRILARTAQNIIDVSAVESQGMEQHECMDRARQYSTRLAKLNKNLTHWKKVPPLPSLTAQPQKVLASDPVPYAEKISKRFQR
ncbi:unnamed protein product [Staurois parvus]|uniref:Ragulator complex protein LAMTOR1 n=1 Tax=Staurois parvus TaxID=386267 RepID=A0ABN9ERV7_9NEOB|nr:unnamed protein product [Staurois parvus]